MEISPTRLSPLPSLAIPPFPATPAEEMGVNRLSTTLMIFRPPCTAVGGSSPVTGRRHSGEAPRDKMLFSSR
ncbi:hypothetical protein JCGZ_10374 [Jatropha curcas]|uniref:Uncharacterized protein n=1 Tax=Jatropha curcas TaxID=180498 RepID=A0A067KSY2_JATCU|nr:hypothetical protein JCGZ_10374 [Jatropha curcas]